MSCDAQHHTTLAKTYAPHTHLSAQGPEERQMRLKVNHVAGVLAGHSVKHVRASTNESGCRTRASTNAAVEVQEQHRFPLWRLLLLKGTASHPMLMMTQRTHLPVSSMI
jgi:hypothetical protein